MDQDQIDDLMLIIEDLSARLEDADGAAARALQARDVFRDQLARTEYSGGPFTVHHSAPEPAMQQELSKATAEVLRLKGVIQGVQRENDLLAEEVEFLMLKAKYYKAKAKRPRAD